MSKKDSKTFPSIPTAYDSDSDSDETFSTKPKRFLNTITEKWSSDSDSSKNIMKFQELKINKTYIVIECSESIKSLYGTSYVLKLVKQGSKEKFKVWSGTMLAKYITEEKPTKKITFTVKTGKNVLKYPEIKGYNDIPLEYDFVKLGSDSE